MRPGAVLIEGALSREGDGQREALDLLKTLSSNLSLLPPQPPSSSPLVMMMNVY